MDTLKEAAQETGKAVDSGVRAASELLLSGAHEAAAQYQTAQERSERFLDTAVAHYRATEEAAFDKLKGTVLLSADRAPAATNMCTDKRYTCVQCRGNNIRQRKSSSKHSACSGSCFGPPTRSVSLRCMLLVPQASAA